MKNPMLPDTFYHIYNRGNNKEVLFKEKRNYKYFLKLWDKYISPVADTYCYNLLSNHFHFLIKIKEEQTLNEIDKYRERQALHLSRVFANLFDAYAKAINVSTGRTGSLFQENVKRKSVDSFEYCKTLVLYIHTNAERHKLLKDFKAYEHSSWLSFLVEKQTNLKKKEVLELFDGKENFILAHEEYARSFRQMG